MPIGPRVGTTVTNQSQTVNRTSNDSEKEDKKPVPVSFVPQHAKFTFDEIILPKNTLDSIQNALAIKNNSDLVFETWGFNDTHKHSKKIGINLYGPPGTGKTMVAHAIANELQKKIMIINYADIESKYVGDTPKNLTQAFEVAKSTGSILFFDEADAILSRRVTNMNNATDTSVNQTRSVLLTLLNDYQGVILFATNYISNFDPAFMRRILAHIQFELPDYDCRVKLLQRLIPKKLPHKIDIHQIAKNFDNLSGSDLSNAVLMSAFKAARNQQSAVDHHDLHEALESVVKSKNANLGQSGDVKVETRPVTEEYASEQLKKHGGEIK
jgi:ATP-dependent 26S proteasome regulatory subunit